VVPGCQSVITPATRSAQAHPGETCDAGEQIAGLELVARGASAKLASDPPTPRNARRLISLPHKEWRSSKLERYDPTIPRFARTYASMLSASSSPPSGVLSKNPFGGVVGHGRCGPPNHFRDCVGITRTGAERLWKSNRHNRPISARCLAGWIRVAHTFLYTRLYSALEQLGSTKRDSLTIFPG